MDRFLAKVEVDIGAPKTTDVVASNTMTTPSTIDHAAAAASKYSRVRDSCFRGIVFDYGAASDD